MSILTLKILVRQWAIVPLGLALLSACNRQEKAEEPAPAVCGECETCDPVPRGPSMLTIGMYG